MSAPEIVLLNGNTTAAMTAWLVSAAAPLAPPGLSVRGVTAPFGAPYVSDPAAYALAADAIAAMARALAARPPAAAVIACFGDPGLWTARAALPCPVIGMAEASLHAACQIGRRVGVVTGGPAWRPMLEAFVAEAGLSSRLAGVRALPLTGAEIAADPVAATQGQRAAAADLAAGGADVVILGGAGLVGLAPAVGEGLGVRVLCSLACAMAQAGAAVALARG